MRTPSRADRVSSCWCDVRVGMYVEAGDGEDRIYDTLATKAAETRRGQDTLKGGLQKRERGSREWISECCTRRILLFSGWCSLGEQD